MLFEIVVSFAPAYGGELDNNSLWLWSKRCKNCRGIPSEVRASHTPFAPFFNPKVAKR